MAIQLFVSNHLSNLAKQLASDLRQTSLGVFNQQHIVTQTEGMNNWLKISLAEQLGITANCSFEKPNDVVSMIYYWLGGFDKPMLSADFVKWNLFHLFHEKEFIQRFPAIAGYYNKQDVKRIALATKVADLFDQYQVYRPDTVAAWGKTELTDTTIDWQQYLWVRLHLQMKDKMFDKTDAIRTVIDKLRSEDNIEILKLKLPHLHFFGIAVITPFYLELFYELSQHINISFYLLNPAPTSYWLEDKSEKEIARIIQKAKKKLLPSQFSTIGNELLQSWGNIIKDSFSLLFEEETFINSYNDSLAENPSEPRTLLQKVQHDIYFNAGADERNKIDASDITDGSITINSCYTLVREVEVLYNYLVQQANQKSESISPRDMVVMVSDIDNYAPYIRAVFDNAPYDFPYTIADESIALGNSMFTSIEMILNLQADSFKAEEILELLESAYIRKRFAITNTELIRKAVDAASIRFGDRGSIDNDTRLVSWQYGLKRILYGICIGGEPIVTLDGDTFIPLDNFEGADSLELIRFWNLFQIIEETVKQRNQSRGIGEWGRYLQELVENLVFESGEKEDEDYHRLISYLEKLTLLENVSDEMITFEVFRHSFLEILNTETKAMSFAGAGITFCSLIPMRSIPFKIVAMLGMDFDKFPRKENKISFSLLEREKRKGDRNVKDNDKHLFLETLLSAKQSFYLSYIGCSTKDATKIPPSSMVDELIDYLVRGATTDPETLKAKLVTLHPLHGFSQKYFNGSGLKSYLSDDKYRTAEGIPVSGKESLVFHFEEISVKDLQQFFTAPIKWYFNKGLGIYYRENEILLPDTEVFELDFLSQWQIKNELLELTDTEIETNYERQRLNGKLPLKNMGRIAFETMVDEIKKKGESIREITFDESPTTIDIRLPLGDSMITGKLVNIYNHRMVSYSDSKMYHKYVIEGYLYYLLATASGYELDFYFKELKSDTLFNIVAGTIRKQEAHDRLMAMLVNYKLGFNKPYLFSPSFGLEMFKEDGPLFVAEIEKMRTKEYDYVFNDDYMNKAYQNSFFKEENFEIIKSNTENIYHPILELMPNIIK